jgi:hypothetical protein
MINPEMTQDTHQSVVVQVVACQTGVYVDIQEFMRLETIH